MNRGAIVLTKFPFTDLSAAKRRPGIIISSKASTTDDVIIAFISSVVPLNPGSPDYFLLPGHHDFNKTGLKKGSVIKLDKIATINVTLVTGEIGFVSGDTMKEIDKRLKVALGLE